MVQRQELALDEDQLQVPPRPPPPPAAPGWSRFGRGRNSFGTPGCNDVTAAHFRPSSGWTNFTRLWERTCRWVSRTPT